MYRQILNDKGEISVILEKGGFRMPIIIRRAESNDIEAINRLFSYPKVIWGTLQMPFPSLEIWRKRISEGGENNIILLACAEKEVLGQAGLHTFSNNSRRRHAGQVGVVVRDDWHGKGVGTILMEAIIDYADKWLDLMRLELDVYTDNEAAIRLYEKFGFVIEGTRTKYAFREGHYSDTYMMARIRLL